VSCHGHNNWRIGPGGPGVPVLMMENDVGEDRPTTAAELTRLLTVGPRLLMVSACLTATGADAAGPRPSADPDHSSPGPGADGGASVTVSQVKATGTGFSTSNTSSMDLAPGQSTDIAVSFKPTASGSASGNLTIDVVGASDPATVPLDGTGTTTTQTGQLAMTPAQLSFGNVNVGSSKNLTETIQATNADVNISSAAWNGAGYSVSGITFPVTVQAGISKTFTVTFAPQTAGAVSGNLSLASNAANSPSTSTFSGTGVQVAQQHVVNLTWAASTSTVAGYNVYRGTQSGGPYARVNSSLNTATNYADSSVQSGQVYFYVATAVDSSSNESAYSGEVAAAVPNP